MIKAFHLFVVFLFTIHSTNAQKEGQPLADSLEQVLNSTNITETQKVDVLAKLAFEYRNLLPKKGVFYGEQAERLARRIQYNKKLGEIYLNLSISNLYYSETIKAYELALKSIKYNTDYHITELIPYSRYQAIISNPNISNKNGLIKLQEILPEVNNIKDKEIYIRTIGAIGNQFRQFGSYKTSDSLVTLAIKEARKYNFKFLEYHNLARIQFLFAVNNEYDKSISITKTIIGYLESIREKRIYSELLKHMAANYLQKYIINKNPIFLDSARHYADLSLKIGIEIEYKTLILDCYYLQYKINKEGNNVEKEIEYLEKYITLNDSLYGVNSRSKIEAIAIKQRDEIAKAQFKIKDNEVTRQRIFLYVALAGIVFSILLLNFVFRNYKNQKRYNSIIISEKQRSDELLLNILPAEMAEELKANGTTKAKAFTLVTVMFTDFKDFTTVSEKVSAELLVDEIHYCFSAFDRIIQKYKIEKIKTIGDSYLCASGLPVSNYTHAKDMVNAAFEIRDFMQERKKEKELNDEIPFEIRIGIHTGPVVAGIVGIKKFAYDIWGDTVNLAARMEQNSEAGKINISGSTFELVKDKFNCQYRGKISAKNKGEIDMYFVETVS